MPSLKDTDAAYIAGILDGEGCISITFREPREVSREKNSQVMIQVRVAMTDYETIKWLAEVTGSADKVFYYASKVTHHKDRWTWAPTLAQAYEIISQCLPYMKTKKRQAEIFLELVDIRRASTRSYRDWDSQFALVSENMALNKRGV